MIAVLVPTINRAEKLAGLVENIHGVTAADHRIYLVMERDDRDSLDAAARLDVESIVGEFGSCSVALNAGYRESTEPFVAITNDDCVFHRGWDAALVCFRRPNVHVVGLNDGSGDCKCFSLVRRAYIEAESGVFDKPNTLFHTYQSQGPDTEFAFYAILRGVWVDAPGCVVEHRNWRNGANPDHPNYVKARRTINADLAEYERRWPLWDPERRMPPPVATVSPL